MHPVTLRWGDGVTATATKPPVHRRIAAGWAAFRKSIYWGACRRQGGWIGGGIALVIVVTVLGTRVAAATRDLLDKGIVDQTEPLGPLATRLIVLSFIGFFVGTAAKLVFARVGYTLDLDLRNLLYLRLHRTQPSALNRFSTGQIVTRSLADLQALRFFIQGMQLIVVGVPLLIGFSIFMILESPPMFLVGASGIVFNGFLVNKIRHRLWGLSYLQLDQLSRITSAIDEPVRGIRVMKWFGRENDERNKVAAASAKHYQYTLTRERFRAKYDVIFRIAPTAVKVLVLLVGARLVIGGSLSVGSFTVLFTLVSGGAQLSDSLDMLVSLYQLMKTGAGRLNEVLAGGPKETARRFEELPERSTGLEIHRASVAFADHDVVSDQSLSALPGTLTVVTGPPGSGKSTIAGLAAGTLAPTSGQVLLDGIDVDRLHPYDVSGAVRLVEEEPFLFGRTLRENLQMGCRSNYNPAAKVDDAKLLEAISLARAEDVLASLGGSLDTAIGDRGLTLSGGQRQRLALARALVELPRVLVLDDALSAVSPAFEIEIIQGIRTALPEIAIVCVGRRESLTTIADQVVRLPEPTVGATSDLGVDQFDLADAGLAITTDTPYDERLVSIVSNVPLDKDAPTVDRAVAERDEPVSATGLFSAVKRLGVLVFVILIAYEVVGLIPEYLIGDATNVIETGQKANEAGDAARAATQQGEADKIALLTLGTAIAMAAIYFARRMTLAKTLNNVLYLMRLRVFARLSRLGISHFDRELPGAVSTRVVHDVEKVRRFGEDVAPSMFTIILRGLLTLVIVTVLVPSLGPLAIGFAVVVGLATFAQAPIAKRLFTSERLALGDVVTRFQEDFAGRNILRAYGGERRARAEFGALNRTHRDAQRRVEILQALFSQSLEVVRDVCIALVYLRAGNLVIAGALTTGTVITVRLYLEESFRYLPRLAECWQQLQNAAISIRQINTLWDAEPLPIESPNATTVNEVEGAITFENVSFAYPGTDQPVLQNVSFEVVPGDRVAIVGHTGAGKSSIAKLLGRIYDPDGGRILVDGQDIKTYELRSYRQRIGVVPQEAFLFRGTVASNIAYAKQDATREELEEAARLVGAYDTLAALEGDFDAKVEEEGRNLTAAERQLIALARSVLAAPDILVLDEATSSLDAATEAKVIDAVLDLGITTVLVTHRLPLAERADFVLMLDGGKVIAAGTHTELVASGESYASLWGVATVGPRATSRRRRAASRAGDPEAVVDLDGTRPKATKTAAKKTAKVGARTAAAGAKKPTVIAKKVTAAKRSNGSNGAKTSGAAKANGSKANGSKANGTKSNGAKANGAAAAKKPAARKG